MVATYSFGYISVQWIFIYEDVCTEYKKKYEDQLTMLIFAYYL